MWPLCVGGGRDGLRRSKDSRSYSGPKKEKRRKEKSHVCPACSEKHPAPIHTFLTNLNMEMILVAQVKQYNNKRIPLCFVFFHVVVFSMDTLAAWVSADTVGFLWRPCVWRTVCLTTGPPTTTSIRSMTEHKQSQIQDFSMTVLYCTITQTS